MQQTIKTTEQLTMYFNRWRSSIEVPNDLVCPLYWSALGIDERRVAELNTMLEAGEVSQLDYCTELARIIEDRDELIQRYGRE